MAGTQYCTVPDVLALVALDAQARLATDPGIPVPLGVKGDGVTTKFDTPFAYSTTLTTVVGGTPTANTISPGTAADGICDQVVFAVAPALGALITCAADLKAVNIGVVRQCIDLATKKIKGSMSRYDTENPGALVLAVVNPIAVFYTRWFLRSRRSMNEYDPIIEEYRSNERWLLNLATGKIPLPYTAPIVTAAPPVPTPINAEPSVFDAPYSNPPKDFFT